MDELVDHVGVEVAAGEQPELGRSCDVAGRLMARAEEPRQLAVDTTWRPARREPSPLDDSTRRGR